VSIRSMAASKRRKTLSTKKSSSMPDHPILCSILLPPLGSLQPAL